MRQESPQVLETESEAEQVDDWPKHALEMTADVRDTKRESLCDIAENPIVVQLIVPRSPATRNPARKAYLCRRAGEPTSGLERTRGSGVSP